MIVDWYTRGAFNGITRGVISSTPDSALLRSLRASFGGVYGGGGGELADSADRPCCLLLLLLCPHFCWEDYASVDANRTVVSVME